MSFFRAWAVRPISRPLLPRPSCSYPRHYVVKEPRSSPLSRHRRVVFTLNPSLITSSDFVDISGIGNAAVQFPASQSPRGRGLSYMYKKGRMIPFPDDTRGFMYYFSVPHAGPLEGSLRFRVTSNHQPSSFHSGHDLLAPSGFPWQISLAQAACLSTCAYIGEQLVHENMVAREQLSRCQSVFQAQARFFPQYTLFRLDSTFLINFSSSLSLTIVGKQLHRVQLDSVFQETLEHYHPWAGKAEARFEPSTRPENVGRRVLHLRIVKIIEPVASTTTGNGHVCRPEEGELFMVKDARNGVRGPWAYDIDRAYHVGRALRDLWDNSQTP
ncbi:hypothetical protein DFH09DRAFT_1362349 [Mycena vulgaris]|nr:hypothetical protein DFH09DRAFT_1362349 [Mycena vulgaris]